MNAYQPHGKNLTAVLDPAAVNEADLSEDEEIKNEIHENVVRKEKGVTKTSKKPKNSLRMTSEFSVNQTLDPDQDEEEDVPDPDIEELEQLNHLISDTKEKDLVDLSDIPSMPEKSSEAVIHSSNERRTSLIGKHEDDKEAVNDLIAALTEQITKLQGYSEQHIHNGDVDRANAFDSLLEDTQRDLDFVKNIQRRGYAAPQYYFKNDTFQSTPIIPQLKSRDLELIIVQILDLSVSDDHPLIEWQMPFPHDNPIKGKTEKQKVGVKFNQSFFVPITRKSKPFQRAIRTKAVKLTLVSKGGLLGGDKVLGKALVKLEPLQSNCELRAVEEFRDGRNITGKVEVKIRIRTPLDPCESHEITEKWIVVNHDRITGRSSLPTKAKVNAPQKKSKVCSIL